VGIIPEVKPNMLGGKGGVGGWLFVKGPKPKPKKNRLGGGKRAPQTGPAHKNQNNHKKNPPKAKEREVRGGGVFPKKQKQDFRRKHHPGQTPHPPRIPHPKQVRPPPGDQ